MRAVIQTWIGRFGIGLPLSSSQAKPATGCSDSEANSTRRGAAESSQERWVGMPIQESGVTRAYLQGRFCSLSPTAGGLRTLPGFLQQGGGQRDHDASQRSERNHGQDAADEQPAQVHSTKQGSIDL